ncbi:hypothetical protein KM043_009088 [Ampulex compressa]|nr:hypothetical protein KM043_009088 [Ampulex compressa]
MMNDRSMEISPRKSSKRAQEPVDEWLQNEGYYRKHAPRDPTCLFRAISEQVYSTQHYHIRVRRECVEYMAMKKQLFTENVSIPFESYLEQMACFTEWGGMNEIQAMSLLYKKEMIIFNGQKQTRRTVTNNGFKDVILLCHTPQKQYESVYTREHVANAAYCQSIVYQILYKDVFNMANTESTVHKMLHDRSGTLRHDKFFLKGNLEIRDQLTAEIYNKVEKDGEPFDEMQSITKGILPFPYRVAKALDPNIYRNTDFDIWHEIRREVKNAGWTRHNSNELQIGGKCLVQMDFNDDEVDKANNNSIYACPFEKDINGNEEKVTRKRTKQDPILFYGHIQEMSKNEGPVLVFIEELGEKKTVPYASLKPLPIRKNKQNNWQPLCKRNILLDSSQKWKKASNNATSRKARDSIASGNILSNNDQKTGTNNNICEINKNALPTNFWSNESGCKTESLHGFEKYGVEKNSTYAFNNSSGAHSMAVIYNNQQPTMIENIKQDMSDEFKENLSTSARNTAENDSTNKNTKSMSTVIPQDNDGQSRAPFMYDIGSTNDTVSESNVEHILHSVNCSAQKSMDVNGTDLPLSDPFTLRFFYNLGLEYFRVSHVWGYAQNGHFIGLGPGYQNVPTATGSPNLNNIVPSVMQKEEGVNNITHGIQDCAIINKEESNNQRKDVNTPAQSQEISYTCNNAKDTETLTGDVQKNENRKYVYPLRDRIKEHAPVNKDSQKVTRNGVAPRFKKNPDNWHRNVRQQLYAQHQHHSNQHQYSTSNANFSKQRDAKGESMHPQHVNPVSPPVNLHTGTPNSYHAPYMQQSMYTVFPCYSNEAEAFPNPYYVPNPGYIPVHCIPHSEISDNNNTQPYPLHSNPSMDIYPQAYPGLCPPYVYPQPAAYNVSSQNMQEHWYAYAGQPHYVQYAPIMPVATESQCNGTGQNDNLNI